MKKLLILTALLALECGYAATKNVSRTADEYKAMIAEKYRQIYEGYWLSDANVQTVVDKNGKVLSMEFTNSDQNQRAFLRPEGNTVLLTVEQIGEDDSEGATSHYIFDNLLRMTNCDLHVLSTPWDQTEFDYTLELTYANDSPESKSMQYRFRKGIHQDYDVVDLNLFPNCAPFVFAAGEGILVEYSPELGYKQFSSATFLDSDGKPKTLDGGYSSIRVSYLLCPEDSSEGFWRMIDVIGELRTANLDNSVTDDENYEYYISKIEFLDNKGNLVNTTNGAAQAVIDLSTNDNGDQTLNQRYLDRDGRLVNQQVDSCAFARIEYIRNDSVHMATLYAADGSLAQSSKGVARYYNKETENEEIICWTDKDGNYVLVEDENNEGVFYGLRSQRYYNNDQGQRVRHISYRGTSDSDRVNCAEGYSDQLTCSNPEDEYQEYSESYFGADGKPAVCASLGYAVKRSTYNADNVITGIAYFGADDKLIEVNGIAREAYGYRSKNDTYSPDFTWYYNGKDEMITPENMPVKTDEDEDEDEESDDDSDVVRLVVE